MVKMLNFMFFPQFKKVINFFKYHLEWYLDRRVKNSTNIFEEDSGFDHVKFVFLVEMSVRE